MAENHPKTLKDYLLEGGIKGKYFVNSDHERHSQLIGPYTVLSLDYSQETGKPVIVTHPLIAIYSEYSQEIDFRSHLSDLEATPEEVQRTKEEESRLVQKLSS
jgi:hypothetical protein